MGRSSSGCPAPSPAAESREGQRRGEELGSACARGRRGDLEDCAGRPGAHGAGERGETEFPLFCTRDPAVAGWFVAD